MKIMKANGLIEGIKKQTRNTVWKHLDALAADSAVYSTHLKGLSPFLTDYDAYMYCNDTSVVIVCLDYCGHGAKSIYDESKHLSAVILSDYQAPRLSVVWQVAMAVDLVKTVFEKSRPNLDVYGLLLTEANILNVYPLEEMWDVHHVRVIDDFRRLRGHKIKVNENDTLRCKSYVGVISNLSLDDATVDIATTSMSSVGEVVDDDIDDLFRTPDENNGLLSDSNSESDNCCDNDDEEENKDIKNVFDDFLFPEGTISQNPTMNVKVNILQPIDNPREELDNLVGCGDIKRRMDELVALTNYNKMMCKLFPNGKRHDVSLHSVFLGRPGTGKTTVCKIYGSLLHQAGALSKGHVVLCDRGTFIGTLWGDEERSVRQVLEVARGGVLMIDEAYLLNGKHEHDPGKLVLPLLMNILADETQRDIAVVLCGYKEPMMKMLDSNPGLQSRFPNMFEFQDFSVSELLEITRRRIRDYEYQFTTEAWEKFCGIISGAYSERDPDTWGNARFIANQLERIYIRHAERCMKQRPASQRELLMLTPEDIVPIHVARPRARIGF
ncbi:AAA family ATPase [Pseudoprevotella muciniphila]|uniref:AAA family ATPase n=1 Tax=Pseudoprevotella muciniphila TaxID=2133944 RepID=A0A5P8E610_9BACT|nr:AAA family ATPase [Pseudoprevotella muciniphila]QFQ12479.1 AAA family ATPase [Pseudoprevotella muciniphila]